MTPSPSRALATAILNALDAWDDERTKGMPPKSKSQIIAALIDGALEEVRVTTWKEAKEDAWEKWQEDVKEARSVALEDAAKIVETATVIVNSGELEYPIPHREYVAAKIRAL